ncbi:MAG: hypothetical protein NZ700_03210 [Gemmataceae bacterium]|nr:hypothetical protein [Gemmataceae bacterium]MDW8267058.1 hypothetical protein [Gemmataceae bacterium]
MLFAKEAEPTTSSVLLFSKDAEPAEQPAAEPPTLHFAKEAEPLRRSEPPLLPTFSTATSIHFGKPAAAPPPPASSPPRWQTRPSPFQPAGLQPEIISREGSGIHLIPTTPGPEGLFHPTQQTDDFRAPGEDTEGYTIQLEPPGLQRVMRLESEAALLERLRQEARQRPIPERIEFPVEPIVSTETYQGRYFPPAVKLVEPAYLCYNRLYFEQLNAERYGWDLGAIHPFLAAGRFYTDVITWPYRFATAPCRQYECNAGYCLPGDPVPFMIYPPELSLTGGLNQAGWMLLFFIAFP